MSQDPEVIRQNVAETQTQIGETAEALAYKADFPSRARDAVHERVDAIKGTVSDTISSVGEAMPSPSEGLRVLRSTAQENPVGLAVASIAAGFLIGLCLPVSSLERERVGRLGEQMTEQAKSAASDAIEQGKAAVTQAIGDAISGSAQPAA